MNLTSPGRSIVTAARELVARAERVAARNPVVAWRGLTETVEEFDSRVLAVRDRLVSGVPLLAVTPPHPEPMAGVRLVELTEPMFALLHPSHRVRSRVAYGGRGSAKSYSIATVLVLLAVASRVRILCAREIQRSIRESVHRMLVERIDGLGLSPYFDVLEHSITSCTGSEFLFEGLFANVSKIKSLAGINICFVEESERISARSLEVLIPTIREPGSELWFALNPDQIDDPVFDRFILGDPPRGQRARVNFDSNPWFPPELELERAYLQRVDDDAYRHVWLGEPRHASDAQILKGKYVVEDFEPAAGWSGPYYGADWGFSVDPTTLIRCWIAGRVLYVEHEAYAIGCELDATPALFDTVPGARAATIRADCARPETISYLQRHGYAGMRAVEKWKGSVEDGVAHLRQYEKIVIHSRARHAIEEARLWSYRVDRLTGDVLAEVAPGADHVMDAIRYALQPLIRAYPGQGIFEYYREQAEALAKARA